MSDRSAKKIGVFAKNNMTRTVTKVPEAGVDNHLGVLGSSGVWPSVTGNGFLPGFAPGQGQLLMTHDNTSKIGGSVNESVGVDEVVAITNNASETVGAAKVIDVGTTLLIKAGTSITLKCGASTIHMNQAGFITISGTVVTMTGAINANVAAPLTNIAGAVMLTNSGAINLVNGIVTRIHGHTLAHVDGAKTEVVATSENIIQGLPVKIN